MPQVEAVIGVKQSNQQERGDVYHWEFICQLRFEEKRGVEEERTQPNEGHTLQNSNVAFSQPVY